MSDRPGFVGTLERRDLKICLRFRVRVQNPARDHRALFQGDPMVFVLMTAVHCQTLRRPVSKHVWIGREAGLLDGDDVLCWFETVEREHAIGIGRQLAWTTSERSSLNIYHQRQGHMCAADRRSSHRVRGFGTPDRPVLPVDFEEEKREMAAAMRPPKAAKMEDGQ